MGQPNYRSLLLEISIVIILLSSVAAADLTPTDNWNYQDFYNITKILYLQGSKQNFTTICLTGDACRTTWPTDAGAVSRIGGSPYLYNDSTTIYLNETYLNSTIELLDTDTNITNCSVAGSCPNIIYTANESGLDVNSADLWDALDTPTDLNYGILVKQENVTNEDWIEDSQEGDLDVNSSTWWAGVSSYISSWFSRSAGVLQFNDGRLNNTFLKLDASNDPITDNLTVQGNMTITGYFEGQPIEGSIGSGVIYCDDVDSSGSVNLSVSGLDVTYPNMIVRLVNTSNQEKYCNITSGTITLTDNTHNVVYVDADCSVKKTTMSAYIATDLSPGGLADIFNAYTEGGEIGIYKGTTLKNKESIKTRKNLFYTDHLDIISGMVLTQENEFPVVSQSTGQYFYIRGITATSAQNSSSNGIHIVGHSGGAWTHNNESGLNLSYCDDGTNFVPCADNRFRRYVIYTIGRDDGTDTTKMHMLTPPTTADTFTTLSGCLNIENTPISYTLPDVDQYVAVPTYVYCGRRDDTSWSGGMIDIRVGDVGHGARIDTSIFLTKDGTTELTANWDAGNYNITASSFFADTWGDVSITKSQVSDADWWDSIGDVPTATPSNGDTTHLSTADQIYDFVIGLAYATTTYVDNLIASVGNWTADKGDYWTASTIEGFGYYNSTDFSINDYYSKNDIEGFGYYNATDFSIFDYYTKSDIEGFSYYNSSDFDYNDYYLNSNPDSYWNDTYATFNKTYADTLYLTSYTETDPLWSGNQSNYYTQAYANNTFQFDIASDCGAGEYVYGVNDDGSLNCRTDQQASGGISLWQSIDSTVHINETASGGITDINVSDIKSTTDQWCNNTACWSIADFLLDTDTTYTGGNAITLDGTTINFDGGASPGGELGGTWANPTIDSGIHDDEYIKLDDSFGGDVSGTYDAITLDCSEVVGSGLSCSGENIILSDISADSSPQLGGYLDTNGNTIGSASDEIDAVYVADDTKIYFGNDQDVYIMFNTTANAGQLG